MPSAGTSQKPAAKEPSTPPSVFAANARPAAAPSSPGPAASRGPAKGKEKPINRAGGKTTIRQSKKKPKTSAGRLNGEYKYLNPTADIPDQR